MLPLVFLLLTSAVAWTESLGLVEGVTAPTDGSAAIDQGEACRDLNPGESRIVSLGSELSPTGIPARYMITRNDKNEFTVTLNILMGADGPDREVRKATTAKMKEKVESCFNEFTSTFKDGSGRKINLDVQINDPKIVTENWYNPINIRENPIRENSQNLSMSSTCAVITHEFMHLMGLCDLYHETEKQEPSPSDGFDPVKKSFNCRAVPQNPNRIMANSGDWPGGICRCENPKSAECSAATVKKKLRGRTAVSDCLKGFVAEFLPTGAQAKIKKASSSVVMTIPLLPAADSDARRILSAAEMNAVIYNGCLSKNKTYYTCAKFAYITTEEGRCPDLPDVCKSDKWLDEVEP